MDKLIPLPASLDGTRFIEVTYTLGDAEPVAFDWPLVGWENTERALPVVIETDGRLATKMTSRDITQLAGGSNTFFVTRQVRSTLDVNPEKRALKQAMMREFSLQTPGQTRIDDTELPA